MGDSRFPREPPHRFFPGGVPARDRRHGDPFPLPGPPLEAGPVTPEQRRQRRRVVLAAKSVNHFAAATINARRAMGFDAPPQPDLRPTAVQRHMLTDMQRHIGAYGLQLEDMNEEGALAEVLSSRDLYPQDPKHIADYNFDKLKVVRRAFQPLGARARLPPDARALLEDFHVHIERTEAEMFTREAQDTPRPYLDPKLHGSRSEMLRLFLALYERGLMSLRSKLKRHIGIFFVRKKDDMIPLIVDARAANLHHKIPPVTRLGSASCMASLDLSDARLRSTGFRGLVELDPAATRATSETATMYNFLLEELASWFGVPIAFKVQELQEYGFVVDSIFDHELGAKRPVYAQDTVYFVFSGASMGWSWGLYVFRERSGELPGQPGRGGDSFRLHEGEGPGPPGPSRPPGDRRLRGQRPGRGGHPYRRHDADGWLHRAHAARGPSLRRLAREPDLRS